MAKRPSMFLGLVKERPSVSLCLGLGPKHVSVWARCRERDMFFVVTCSRVIGGQLRVPG